MLKGEAKTRYMRDYMRRRRACPPDEMAVPTLIKSIRNELAKSQAAHAATARLFKVLKQRPESQDWQRFVPKHLGFPSEWADQIISQADEELRRRGKARRRGGSSR